MMYRCEVCGDMVGPRVQMLQWFIHRPDGQIERQVKVCHECKEDLDAGVSLSIMLDEHRGGRDGARAPVRLMGQPVIVLKEARKPQKILTALPETVPEEAQARAKNRKRK